MSDQSVPLRLAATAVLLRNSNNGIETLLLRRNAKLAFAGGAWVFPGGAIDADELEAAASEEEAAAARETFEEAGIEVSQESFQFLAHWTPPPGPQKRFATWFFVGNVDADSGKVVIDDGEIHEFQWIRPEDAITLHHQDELTLMPPTYLSLSLLTHYETAELACSALAVRKPYDVMPRLCQFQDEMVCLYPGDAGYQVNDPVLPGARHRTVFTPKGMEYAHSGEDVGVAPMDKP